MHLLAFSSFSLPKEVFYWQMEVVKVVNTCDKIHIPESDSCHSLHSQPQNVQLYSK